MNMSPLCYTVLIMHLKGHNYIYTECDIILMLCLIIFVTNIISWHLCRFLICSTQIYTRPIWDGSSAPTKGLGKLQIRDSDYRNHWIFNLRCISKSITPVSIRLKTTVRTEKARKIIRNAERDLLQARAKSINNLLDNNVKQKDLCRSQLVSIISTTSMLEC